MYCRCMYIQWQQNMQKCYPFKVAPAYKHVGEGGKGCYSYIWWMYIVIKSSTIIPFKNDVYFLQAHAYLYAQIWRYIMYMYSCMQGIYTYMHVYLTIYIPSDLTYTKRALHVLKHLHTLLGVALADLAQSLVLVTTLLYILSMEQIHVALLTVITSRCQLRCEWLQCLRVHVRVHMQ